MLICLLCKNSHYVPYSVHFSAHFRQTGASQTPPDGHSGQSLLRQPPISALGASSSASHSGPRPMTLRLFGRMTRQWREGGLAERRAKGARGLGIRVYWGAAPNPAATIGYHTGSHARSSLAPDGAPPISTNEKRALSVFEKRTARRAKLEGSGEVPQ